jgi:hypothetical protein
MKFDPIPPLIISMTFGMMGLMSYIIVWDSLPENLQKGIMVIIPYFVITSLPIIIWSGITKTDKELEEWKITNEKHKKENNDIIKKYESMSDLE